MKHFREQWNELQCYILQKFPNLLLQPESKDVTNQSPTQTEILGIVTHNKLKVFVVTPKNHIQMYTKQHNDLKNM